MLILFTCFVAMETVKYRQMERYVNWKQVISFKPEIYLGHVPYEHFFTS